RAGCGAVDTPVFRGSAHASPRGGRRHGRNTQTVTGTSETGPGGSTHILPRGTTGLAGTPSVPRQEGSRRREETRTAPQSRGTGRDGRRGGSRPLRGSTRTGHTGTGRRCPSPPVTTDRAVTPANPRSVERVATPRITRPGRSEPTPALRDRRHPYPTRCARYRGARAPYGNARESSA